MNLFRLILLTVFLMTTASASGQVNPISENAHPGILFRNIRVIPMSTQDPVVLENVSVLVRGGRIIAIRPDQEISVPEDVLIIDGRGRTMLPGLIDMHVHVWDEAELAAYLSYGVTTVRNASGMPFHLDFQKQIESGKLIGPRLFTTGPILNSPGPNAQINHQMVKTADQAREAVRAQYRQGYRRLKVYSNLTREAYEAILDEAANLGMTVMGHSPEGIREHGVPHEKPFNISFRELLDDGFVTFEHMESIVWHALADDLDEEKARALAKEIAKAGVPISPTLISHRNLLNVAASGGQFLERPGVETLNPFISEIEQPNFEFWAAQPSDVRRDFDAFYARAVKIFHEEGVILVAGTDSGIFTNIPGASLIDELGFLVEAGLSPYEALTTATRNAAQVLGDQNEFGQIRKGFIADLIIVDDDPLQSIDALNSISGVLVNGQFFDASGLEALREAATKTSYERSKARILEGLAAQGVEQ